MNKPKEVKQKFSSPYPISLLPCMLLESSPYKYQTFLLLQREPPFILVEWTHFVPTETMRKCSVYFPQSTPTFPGWTPQLPSGVFFQWSINLRAFIINSLWYTIDNSEKTRAEDKTEVPPPLCGEKKNGGYVRVFPTLCSVVCTVQGVSSSVHLVLPLCEGLPFFLLNQSEETLWRTPLHSPSHHSTTCLVLLEDLCNQGPTSARTSSSCTQIRNLRHQLGDSTSRSLTC